MVKTGNTKYQKHLKSEKAKVKLKSKKELPKGTNITKTNFKIKKIVIREQLKGSGKDEQLSSKKLNIKELLSRLNHFNTSVKNDAINGIKELLDQKGDVLDFHMDQVIRGVVPLVMDIEKLIRRESFKLLHTILSSSTPEKLEPFFEILLSHLRCAMTHINQNIQEDSLLFLDVLLICTPHHIVTNYQSVMPNFVDMISKLRIDSKPGRMLTLNLGSKMTSVKWRVKVLNRLHQFLTLMVTSQKSNYGNKDIAAYLDSKTVFYNEAKQHFSLFDDSYLANCLLPCFSSQRNNVSAELSEKEVFHAYIEILVPLLFDTWLEVSPGGNKNDISKNESVLPDESADLLGNVLEVMQLLLTQVQIISEMTKTEDLMIFFTKSSKHSFIHHIFSHFPYIRSKKGKAVTESVNDDKMLIENLTICYLFICLHRNSPADENHAKVVIHYLQHNLNSFDNALIQKKYLTVMESLFLADITWKKSMHHVESLLNAILSFYRNTNDNLRQHYFTLLCSLFLNAKHQQLCGLKSYQNWLRELPQILCSDKVSIQTVKILNKFAIQCNKQFNNSITDRISSVISNLPKIHKSYGDNVTAKYCLLSLLYWVKGWDNQSLNLLQEQLRNNEYGENSDFIVDILKIKTQ